MSPSRVMERKKSNPSPRFGLNATPFLAHSENFCCAYSLSGSIHSESGNAVSPPSSVSCKYNKTVATLCPPSALNCCPDFVFFSPSWCAGILRPTPCERICMSSPLYQGSMVNLDNLSSTLVTTGYFPRAKKVCFDVRIGSVLISPVIESTTVLRFIIGFAIRKISSYSSSLKIECNTNARGCQLIGSVHVPNSLSLFTDGRCFSPSHPCRIGWNLTLRVRNLNSFPRWSRPNPNRFASPKHLLNSNNTTKTRDFLDEKTLKLKRAHYMCITLFRKREKKVVLCVVLCRELV